MRGPAHTNVGTSAFTGFGRTCSNGWEQIVKVWRTSRLRFSALEQCLRRGERSCYVFQGAKGYAPGKEPGNILEKIQKIFSIGRGDSLKTPSLVSP